MTSAKNSHCAHGRGKICLETNVPKFIKPEWLPKKNTRFWKIYNKGKMETDSDWHWALKKLWQQITAFMLIRVLYGASFGLKWPLEL